MKLIWGNFGTTTDANRRAHILMVVHKAGDLDAEEYPRYWAEFPSQSEQLLEGDTEEALVSNFCSSLEESKKNLGKGVDELEILAERAY